MMKGIVAQFYTVFCVNLITFIYGIAVGWPSASLPLLQSVESPLPCGPLSVFEASSIGSILCIGGACGQLIFGCLTERFGRKPGIMLASVPLITSWLLIEYGTGYKSLLISRFLSGLSGGAAFQVSPLVVSEIANVEVRGTLASFLILLHNAGIVLGYILCSYTNYFTVPWVGIGLCMVFLISYTFIPETPKYLISRGKIEEAEKSLEFFKGKIDSAEESLRSQIHELSQIHEQERHKLTCKDLCERGTRKAFAIGAILMNISCFCGAFTLTNYYESIFREAGSTLSPAVSSIIVASIQLFGVSLTAVAVEKAGRKILILGSAYGCALCLIVMGIYLCLKDFEIDVTSVTWIPLVCLSLLVFFAANGAGSIPFIVIGEIFAQNIRDALVATCTTINWIMSFILVLTFPYMIEYLKIYGALWIFSVVGATLTTIIAKIMPETKGLSIETIVHRLGGD